jgi:hypothetical protein
MDIDFDVIKKTYYKDSFINLFFKINFDQFSYYKLRKIRYENLIKKRNKFYGVFVYGNESTQERRTENETEENLNKKNKKNKTTNISNQDTNHGNVNSINDNIIPEFENNNEISILVKLGGNTNENNNQDTNQTNVNNANNNEIAESENLKNSSNYNNNNNNEDSDDEDFY